MSGSRCSTTPPRPTSPVTPPPDQAPDQPCHAAAGLGARAAGELVAPVGRSARTAAGQALGAAAGSLTDAGHDVCGMALGLDAAERSIWRGRGRSAGVAGRAGRAGRGPRQAS
ncbi:hypothetical protein HD597_002183 [Nonomuraea thailandensis]|uniref:Uncharacterized protein n=1 Tax=Nonomuraea thailandensis TaxID=1188745 RepID=A0A9X2JZS4_9ACTN|nr:hypothetical protein [Nonomuraea thailandensis]MCP2355163.1 hypothetical protein [Nonomuraea thailandensis]